jgi:hypothetical protein
VNGAGAHKAVPDIGAQIVWFTDDHTKVDAESRLVERRLSGLSDAVAPPVDRSPQHPLRLVRRWTLYGQVSRAANGGDGIDTMKT